MALAHDATPDTHVPEQASRAQWRDHGWKPAVYLMGGLLTIFAFLRWYQQAFAWSKGLDSTLPQFTTYWRSMLVAVLAVGGLGTLSWWAWILATGGKARDQARSVRGEEATRLEISRIKNVWAILAAWCLSLYLMASFFGEQDAVWHQTAVRDTAFTPSHIILFYAAFPLAITFSIGGYLYARTRVPALYEGRRGKFPLSWGLMVAGAILLMAQVALNEWAHSVAQAEERFNAPLHWPFVFYGYLVAATFAVWFETLGRVIHLRTTGATGSAGDAELAGDGDAMRSRTGVLAG